ncbi:hypothetical protein FJY90_03425 [Candidatus Gottesmanbacteria bacterium]|nr:hypothetical protein [Candidatus Gottesmanbacteria bacterium]
MRKLLRPRDYIVVTLGILGDTFEEIKDPFAIQEKGYKYLYGWVPERWQKHNFQRSVERMLKTGDIEKIITSGQPVIRLSSQGKDKWTREFPLFTLSLKPWDGWWRMVGFDIPNILKGKRESLREKIERLGMGRLQESLYITPFDFGIDLREFIESHGLSSFVDVFEARHTFGQDPRDLAWRVWQLEKLEERYEGLLSSVMNKDTLIRKERFQLQVKFEEIILDDPLLPKELLPRNWVGYKVYNLVLNR